MPPPLLPPEIQELIAQYSLHAHVAQRLGSVAALATVSAPWQRVVERRTFNALHLDQRDVPVLNHVVHGARRSHVRSIGFAVRLDAYAPNESQLPETAHDQHRNNVLLTTCLGAFLSSLSEWCAPDDPRRAWITLRLHFYSPTDRNYVEWDPRQVSRPFPQFRRFMLSTLRILPEYFGAQPDVPCVVGLGVFAHEGERTLAKASLVRLLYRLPNAVRLDGVCADNIASLAERIREWNDFAQTLDRFPATLTDLRLSLLSARHVQQRDDGNEVLYFSNRALGPPAGQLLSPASNTNFHVAHSLSLSLGLLTCRLHHVELFNVVLDPIHFFSDQAVAKTWPHLRDLHIVLSQWDVHGESYYLSYEPLRRDETRCKQLCVRALHVIQAMPRLRRLSLDLYRFHDTFPSFEGSLGIFSFSANDNFAFVAMENAGLFSRDAAIADAIVQLEAVLPQTVTTRDMARGFRQIPHSHGYRILDEDEDKRDFWPLSRFCVENVNSQWYRYGEAWSPHFDPRRSSFSFLP